jgi:hypothetical protein
MREEKKGFGWMESQGDSGRRGNHSQNVLCKKKKIYFKILKNRANPWDMDAL